MEHRHWRYWTEEYIDLIISDIMMPVMDGYELVSELRSAGYQIPVLMITAKSSFDDMRQGFLSGSDDYMVKPVNVNEMVFEGRSTASSCTDTERTQNCDWLNRV